MTGEAHAQARSPEADRTMGGRAGEGRRAKGEGRRGKGVAGRGRGKGRRRHAGRVHVLCVRDELRRAHGTHEERERERTYS